MIRSHEVKWSELPLHTIAHDDGVATTASYNTNRPVEMVAKH